MVKEDKTVELTVAQVRRGTNLRSLHCKTSDDLEVLNDFIGQERAVRSINFGLNVENKGYGIFVVGENGSGRTSYALKSVTEKAAQMPAPNDWVYVNNFDRPSMPLAIAMPAGSAKTCADDCAKLMEDLKSAISHAFDNREFDDVKSQKLSDFQDVVAQELKQVEESAKEKGFLVKRTAQGFVNIPIGSEEENALESDETAAADGNTELNEDAALELAEEKFKNLSDEEKKRLKAISDEISIHTIEALRTIREKERLLKDELDKLGERICSEAIGPYIGAFRKKYEAVPKFASWVDSLARNIVVNRSMFVVNERPEENEVDFTSYKINPLVCNDPSKGAPVVREVNPSYYNISGKMEYESRQGYYYTDFTKIVAGALHRANGGYLIVNAEDLLRNPMSYDILKRVLRFGTLSVENLSDQMGALPVEAPRPENIPIDMKVVLIGSYDIYYALQEYDPEFSKFFKAVAEFDTDMPRTPHNEMLLARFLKTVAVRENLPAFTKKALAEIIEIAARLAGDQNKLSVQFNRLQEYVIEAASWAKVENAPIVDYKHVIKAINEKRYRSALMEEKIHESYATKVTRIDTKGTVVGQINGLAVVTFADVSFGHPIRITANTYMGQEGVVNIERETSLAGPIHNKGHFTLGSYIGRVYAQDTPLTLSARISFEQNYGGIEGDSASSAELYALLSSLSDIPIRQNIAVTGSVDQFGNVQPIGGVNEKIEGFFAACLQQGLDGTQGVLIPWQNQQHLMLNHQLVDAIKNKKFHVWTCESIDQGIELLTGVKAGKRKEDGTYPPESIHGRAMAKLHKWAEKSSNLSEKGSNEQS